MNKTGIRVLYLEDNPDDVGLVKAYMDGLGSVDIFLEVAETMAEALAKLGQGRYDAMLVDLNLPDSSGLETFTALQKAAPELPMVLLTMVDREGVAIQALRKGAQDYLVKSEMNGSLLLRSLLYSIERKANYLLRKEQNEKLFEMVKEKTLDLSRTNQQLMDQIKRRMQAEQKALENQRVLQSIMDGMDAAVFFIDPETFYIMETSPAGERILALPRERIVGKRCKGLICPQGQKCDVEGCPHLERKMLLSEAQLRRHDGKVIPILKNVVPVTRNSKDMLATIIFDITERKELERQLALAQKLESIGQLAAGIAHEINTPIQYIGSNLNYMHTSFADLKALLDASRQAIGSPDSQPQVKERLKEIVDKIEDEDSMNEFEGAIIDSKGGVERITTIVQAMKRFSYPDQEGLKPVDVNAAIKNTVTVARNEWKYDSEVRLELARNMPPLMCVPGDFNQVVLNLLVNAAQAVSESVRKKGGKGTITLATRAKDGFLEVQVKDDGLGVPLEIQDRIFDPFFTTKEVGTGTGQGLSLVHAIVARHDGEVMFMSAPGEGATFTVRFPLSPDTPK